MQVKVNDECIGCGLCESVCPQVFQIEGARSMVVDSSDEYLELAQQAAESCPVAAIEVG